jgi:DNA primase
MACHLAGVGTAVASCGTAFGDEHAKVLRRFMADHEEFRGEVIFTFDGDAAGQAAALKAFQGDQNFVSQTYVAIEPDGLDPCDVRIKKGDAAVRELVARRVPLYRFVLRNVVAKYDLDRADGRIDALRESARLVSSIRDRSKVDAFARELSSMVGVDVEEARAEVRRASTRRPAQQGRPHTPVAEELVAERPRRELPHLRDPRFAMERETLKLVLQHPMVIGRTTTELGPEDFIHPTYRAVWETVAVGGAGDPGWSGRLRDATQDPAVASAIAELSVEPLPAAKEPTAEYVAQYVVRLLELTALRRIDQVKSKMQRTNPVDNDEVYRRMFGELAALEEHRRKLRDRIVGTS